MRDEKSISQKWDEARERVNTARSDLDRAERDVLRQREALVRAEEEERKAWAEVEKLRAAHVAPSTAGQIVMVGPGQSVPRSAT
jgi:flagellar motility protein MotE (MotC chaperone)